MATPLALDGRPGGLLQRHGVKLAISLVLGIGIVWILSRGGLPILPPDGAFASFRFWTAPAYVATLIVVHFIRAMRWRHLLGLVGKASFRAVLSVSWISFAAILLSPIRGGEVLRPYLITKRSTVRLWEATGTIVAERVIDGLVMSLILFVGLTFAVPRSPLPDHVGELRVPVAAVPAAAYGVLLLFAVAFSLMALFFWRRAFARRVTHAVVGLVSPKLADFLGGAVERVADGLRFLPSWRHSGPFLAETLAYWLINASGTWLLAWGCGLTGVTLSQAMVTMGCLGIGILVPSGPGFFGAFQFFTYMALAMFFPEGMVLGPGAAFVFLLYALQVGWTLAAAGIGLAIDPKDEAPPAALPLGENA
jgi:glycosyltransferase 2 family protein